MVFHLTAIPDVAETEFELPERQPGAVATLHDRLADLYADRLEVYHAQLAAVLGVNAAVGDAIPVSRFPSLILRLPLDDEPEAPEEESLVFDGELFGKLLDLYVCYGWSPIAVVEQTARATLAEELKRRPVHGPAAHSPWEPAVAFFEFCRNMLALLIREELATVERMMAVRLTAHLSTTSVGIAKAWQTFRVKRTRLVKEGTHTKDTGEAQRVSVSYTFQEKELTKDMYEGLSEAVKARVKYEKALDKLEHAKEHMDAMRFIVAQRNTRWVPRHEVQRLRSAELSVLELMDAERATRDFYQVLRANVFAAHPAALLVLDGLEPGFAQDTMETALGETLWQFYERIDELGHAIDSTKLLSHERLHGLPDGELAGAALQRLPVPEGGPSAFLIAEGIARLPDRPAYFTLMHEGTLQELLGSDELDRDSLTFVVAHHHVIELIEALERRRSKEEGWVKFWSAFSRLSAAASIAALFTPETAVLAPFVRGGALISDLVLLAHTVSSAVQQLRLISELLDAQFASSRGTSMLALGRLGELRAHSQVLFENLALGAVLQIGLGLAAARWVPVKIFLLTKGFLTDLETLYGADQG